MPAPIQILGSSNSAAPPGGVAPDEAVYLAGRTVAGVLRGLKADDTGRLVIADETEPFDTAITPKGGVSVTTSSTTVVIANANRSVLRVWNTGEFPVFLCPDDAAAEANKGPYLAAGGHWAEAYTGELRAIAVGGTSVVTYTEF